MTEDTRSKGINQLIHRFLCNEAKRNKIEYHEENTNRYRCRSSSFHSTIFFLNHTSFDPIAKSYLINEMRSANLKENTVMQRRSGNRNRRIHNTAGKWNEGEADCHFGPRSLFRSDALYRCFYRISAISF